MKMNEDYEVMPLFATPVYFSKTKTIDKFEKELEFIKSLNFNLHKCNYLSENQKVHLLPEMTRCTNIVTKHLNNYVENILSCKQQFYITHSWIAKTNPGQNHDTHYHPNSILSGIFYLSANEKSANFRLYKKPFIKEAFSFDYDIKEFNEFNSEFWDFSVHTGDIIIFPSHCSHEVLLNEMQEDRIVFAFNTFVRGVFGQSNYSYASSLTLS
jgi:uncharacterized protein (TIGR02466 family)